VAAELLYQEALRIPSCCSPDRYPDIAYQHQYMQHCIVFRSVCGCGTTLEEAYGFEATLSEKDASYCYSSQYLANYIILKVVTSMKKLLFRKVLAIPSCRLFQKGIPMVAQSQQSCGDVCAQGLLCRCGASHQEALRTQTLQFSSAGHPDIAKEPPTIWLCILGQ